jgi:hypothetical protein
VYLKGRLTRLPAMAAEQPVELPIDRWEVARRAKTATLAVTAFSLFDAESVFQHRAPHCPSTRSQRARDAGCLAQLLQPCQLATNRLVVW